MSLATILERVAATQIEAGREDSATQVVAVSKLQPEERVLSVLREGHHVFGENRVQEAVSKWPDLKAQFPEVQLHLVGQLQTNKARQAMGLFDAIHSVDRPKLARRLANLAQQFGRCPDIFIQINTGEEPQKAGILPAEADAFIFEAQNMDLPVLGLMCLPPLDEEPALHFGLLAKIARRNGLSGLSMGMSGDFETAIRLGATHIRVGTAIFGRRPSQ